MEKQNTLALIALAVCALLLGGIVTYVALPREVEVEVVKQVPVLTEKVVFVDKPVEVIKEVEVEVEVEKIVALDIEETYLKPAIKEFMNEVEDEDDLLECDSEEYDFDDIIVKKIYDGYSVTIEDDEEYSVAFEVKLKYLDTDVEEKCSRTFDVVVSYPTDDDDDVEVDID